MLYAGLFLALLFIPRSAAQSSNVTCMSSYKWASDSLGQNPCLVAAYLETSCGDPPVLVTPIPVGNTYLGPTSAQANPCTCNTVVYSLISACGACQNRSFVSWPAWSQTCTTVYVAKFPLSIPSAVEVPAWAYLDVTLTNNAFNATVAQAFGMNDTQTFTVTSQSSTPAIAPPSSTADPLIPSISPSAETTASHNTHPGAIAGGVVGGILFFTSLALCLFGVHLRRNTIKSRRRNRAIVDLAAEGIVAHPPAMSTSTGDHTIATSYIYAQTSTGVGSHVMHTTRPSMDSLPYTGRQGVRGAQVVPEI